MNTPTIISAERGYKLLSITYPLEGRHYIECHPIIAWAVSDWGFVHNVVTLSGAQFNKGEIDRDGPDTVVWRAVLCPNGTVTTLEETYDSIHAWIRAEGHREDEEAMEEIRKAAQR